VFHAPTLGRNPNPGYFCLWICRYEICSCGLPLAAHNPGMAGYGQFCPVARASEIFAERWTPLILREIMSGRHHFNEILQGLHRISPTLLGERLRRLERADIVEARPNPTGRGSTYYLTTSGTQLAEVVRALGAWGQRWLEVGREHLDPDFLMWRVYKHLHLEDLPARRQVVRFDFAEPRKSYWLVLRRPDPDLCYSDPGFGDDVVVRADLEALVRVYLGQLELGQARAAGLIEIEGFRDAAAAMTRWFPRSGYAAHARRVRYDRGARAYLPLVQAR
jgi:DNA-binding HxlR family transcriptional regulator